MNNDIVELTIRYDGKDADRHEIELHALGESLQGISRIISVAGHFATTGKYAKQMQALDTRTVVRESRAGCFSLVTALQFAKDQGLLQGGLGVIVTAIVSIVMSWRSGRQEEMQALKDSLKTAIEQLGNRDQAVIDRMLTTIERMAESLQPSVRQAIAPIGMTCSSITIGGGQAIDEVAAAAIRSAIDASITEEREWSVLITELDKENSTGKVRLMPESEEHEKRVKARITDPAMKSIGDPYSFAFAEGRVLGVRGKALIEQDGEIRELYISNTV